MEAVGIGISLVAALLGLVSFISLIVPLKALRIPTRKRAFVLLLGSVGLVLVGGLIGSQSPEAEARRQAEAPAKPAQAAAPTPAVVQTPARPAAATPPPAAPPAGPPMPADEAKFIAAVTDAMAAYKGAPNEMAAGGARALRRQNVCAAVRTLQVRDWVGTIAKLSTANDGKGVLTVSVGKDIAVTTWNNTVSDFEHKTLIEPGSAVFNQAVQLKRGDKVVFSGTFFASQEDCVNEQSVSLRGSMTDPAYSFRFSAIRKQ